MEENNIPKVYDPKSFEKKWYGFWEENKLFHAVVDEEKQPYSIVIPPPNVTGQLHMGHALDNTLQDILIRWRRMQGYNTLWMPGCDHAGIATQAKVEGALREEGTNRYELGREKFLERVWQWKEKFGSRIMSQLRSLGSSLDWDRERFTMDEGCSRAVREVFVSLYEKGLIYQGTRITNWCPDCNTAISDIEVEHETEAGHLWHIRYQVKGEDRYVEVATTRPETMFGDTGVAVNPADERYTELVGKTLILPVVNREIPLFADEYVDSAFGTGAVKVTPAHDPNDYEMGLRHNLEQIKVISNTGKMTEGAGKYEGMDRYECRKALVKELQEIGALVSIEDHEHAVGHCSRCHSTIEPMISTQWFVKMESLAKPAAEAVKNGDIKFVPERFTKIYCNWLDNIRDWCISRQLWWGHRIPAWYCDDCGETIVSRTDVEVCPKCGGKHLRQDEDVLDTWFSSGLWPFETMGWPDETPELRQFYPTSTLVTGYDIIFFWVARMVMMGLEFGKDIPFKTVYIHGLVRDEQGRKMSKSLGNGIDPVEVIDQYGADTLRFMLITGNTPGNDMRFINDRVVATRNFANKLWNASRFMLMNLEGFDKGFVPEEADYTLADKWILSRFAKTAQGVTANLEKFELGEAGRLIYEFIWNEFCDWYIELAKARLYDKENIRPRQTAQYVLGYVLERTLRLLHPFMPFITEEIWQHIPHDGISIMVAEWPGNDEAGLAKLVNDDDEAAMTAIMESIKTIRALRLEVNAAPGKKSEVILNFTDEKLREVFAANEGYLTVLAAAEPVTVLAAGAEKPENAMTGVVNGVEIYLPLKGLIDVEKETARLNKELATLDKEISRLEKKLGNQGFLAKAPAEVVAGEQEKLKGYQEKQNAVKERLAYLQNI
ncbi:MAG: valine--tRNA ligase [Anaerovibrio sp.]|uniref:valine--tRNA ligase n=1 Tax=Anaerovibrio sp. TaxID=1872532 RepID=UPI00262E6C4C|nr:valine--tRNA ligase [Anaerovibrio sp.]MDD7678496.1 valine--tRNA ligase [Anaerovibrio sp.]MDY2603075.1 valine--tRNA ligase [Anaerovibrio sp.]